jgi:CheY-like chemotaxis protein
MRAITAETVNKTILLVDSDPQSCERRAQAFRDRGAIVDCAQGAEMARERYRSGTYHLVLVDLGADVVAGQQLTSSIRLKNPRQKIAFLLGVPPYVRVVQSKTAERAEQKAPASPVAAPEPAPAPSDFSRRVRQVESDESKS